MSKALFTQLSKMFMFLLPACLAFFVTYRVTSFNPMQSIIENVLDASSYLIVLLSPFALTLFFHRKKFIRCLEAVVVWFFILLMFVFSWYDYSNHLNEKGAWLSFIVYAAVSFFGILGYLMVKHVAIFLGRNTKL